MQAAQRLPAGTLMQRAGMAAARVIADRLRAPPLTREVSDAATSAHASARTGGPTSTLANTRPGVSTRSRIVVLAGPGSNGGDGRITAQTLRELGFTVVVYGEEDLADLVERERDRERPVAIVDALFGIGLTRPLVGSWAQAVQWVQGHDRATWKVALDVPSGLNADTGATIGEHAMAVDLTVTFLADKPGLHTGRGRDLAGEVVVEDLGAPALGLSLPALGRATLLELAPCQAIAQGLRRGHDCHKGHFGTAIVIGGARGMSGAAMLAARAALHAGAGRVVVGFPERVVAPFDAQFPELMLQDLSSALERSERGAIAVGPGLGVGSEAASALGAVLARSIERASALVLDADALTLVAHHPELKQALLARSRAHPNQVPILTPHPLEAARLLGALPASQEADADAQPWSAAKVQGDRVGAALMLARGLHCVVVLKGAGTVIASPDEQAWIAPVGNAALAMGGTGDLLTGLLCGLLAQHRRPGEPTLERTLLAVWCHGCSASAWTAQGHEPIGATSAELLPLMRAQLHALMALD